MPLKIRSCRALKCKKTCLLASMNSNLTASRVIIRLRTFCIEASPTIWSCYANLNNYLFLYKLIPYLVHKNRKICIA